MPLLSFLVQCALIICVYVVSVYGGECVVGECMVCVCVYGMSAYLYLFICPCPRLGPEDSVGGVLTFPS